MTVLRLVLLTLCFALAACATTAGSTAAELRVSADGRHFVGADGKPFFWLGDTAWELLHRAIVEEAELYLEDRRRKGFNVVQTVILAELGGLRDPNPNGNLPLTGNDPARPNEAYFAHVDAILAMAEARGMYLALLPTWGDKFNRKWGEGPEIFTPENARAFGTFLGRRYKGRRVIWVMGGDRNPETPGHLAIVHAMAEAIRAETGGRQLMTYHPQGGSRSWDFFAGAAWIDFHMFQSGHGRRDEPNYRFTIAGREVSPARPVLDGEPRYEDHPIDWKPEKGWFDAADVRQAAWWSLLSGAAGHTYGNHNIWQMWQPDRQPVSAARTPWRDALVHPGAVQMVIARRLFEAHGIGALEPAQHLIGENPEGPAHQRAGRSGGLLLVYTPMAEPVRVLVPSSGAKWLDPRTGAQAAAGSGPLFDPPGAVARGNDWVLVLRVIP